MTKQRDGWRDWCPVSVDGRAKLVFIYSNGRLQLGIMVEIYKAVIINIFGVLHF